MLKKEWTLKIGAELEPAARAEPESEGVDLGAGIVLTDLPPIPPSLVPCPRCGAGPDKRIDGSGFGRARLTLCGVCAHEFTEE